MGWLEVIVTSHYRVALSSYRRIGISAIIILFVTVSVLIYLWRRRRRRIRGHFDGNFDPARTEDKPASSNSPTAPGSDTGGALPPLSVMDYNDVDAGPRAERPRTFSRASSGMGSFVISDHGHNQWNPRLSYSPPSASQHYQNYPQVLTSPLPSPSSNESHGFNPYEQYPYAYPPHYFPPAYMAYHSSPSFQQQNYFPTQPPHAQAHAHAQAQAQAQAQVQARNRDSMISRSPSPPRANGFQSIPFPRAGGSASAPLTAQDSAVLGSEPNR